MIAESRMEPYKYRVLVVDDEESIRKFVVSFLSQLGYSCVTAVDGEDGECNGCR
jgi:CheY-like chemotaxis protein